jgi:hypothetical protein
MSKLITRHSGGQGALRCYPHKKIFRSVSENSVEYLDQRIEQEYGVTLRWRVVKITAAPRHSIAKRGCPRSAMHLHGVPGPGLYQWCDATQLRAKNATKQ